MGDMQVNAASRQSVQPPERPDKERGLCEMMKEAREKVEAAREKFEEIKPKPRYGDAAMEAYSRLARARRPAEAAAAAGYARRQILRLKSAKRSDPENAQRIQAEINQLQKAVSRAGKKGRELTKEKAEQVRQERLAREKKTKEALRQKQELRRKQAMRMIRESGYIREAGVDNRMQAQLQAVRMELRQQARDLAEAFQPSAEAVALQYAAAGAPVEAVGGEVDLQA